MTTIKHPVLAEYAALLQDAGFTIYETKRDDSTAGSRYFLYSQVVDGRECFGSVQLPDYVHLSAALNSGDIGPSLSHSMPMRPTRQHGSSMFVARGKIKEIAGNTLAAARAVAQPFNSNPVVGRHENWEDPYWLDRIYIRRQS